MRRRANSGWKIFGWIIGTLAVLAGIFCLVTLIMASCNGVTFGAEIQSWFNAVQATPPADEVVETTASVVKMLI